MEAERKELLNLDSEQMLGIMEVNDTFVVFSDEFIDESEPIISELGWNKYSLRHPDFTCEYPSTIENKVVVNFWGCILSKDPIELSDGSGNDKFRKLSKKEIKSMNFGCFTGDDDENEWIWDSLKI